MKKHDGVHRQVIKLTHMYTYVHYTHMYTHMRTTYMHFHA